MFLFSNWRLLGSRTLPVMFSTLMLNSAFACFVKLHNISRMSPSLEIDTCFLSKPKLSLLLVD